MQKVRVIIEGPDGCGKSTLAAHLAEELGTEVYHSGGPKESLADVLFGHAKLLNSACKVFDRADLISNEVYRQVFKKPSLLSYRTIVDLLKASTEPTLIIYCSTEEPRISEEKKAHKSEEFLAKIIEQQKAIKQEYKRLFLYLESSLSLSFNDNVRLILYDFTKAGEESINLILANYKDLQDA